jgi:hypothetical protein
LPITIFHFSFFNHFPGAIRPICHPHELPGVVVPPSLRLSLVSGRISGFRFPVSDFGTVPRRVEGAPQNSLSLTKFI